MFPDVVSVHMPEQVWTYSNGGLLTSSVLAIAGCSQAVHAYCITLLLFY
jgi:hypothetical protein